MYLFEDYFDETKENIAYENEAELLRDLLSLLDLILQPLLKKCVDAGGGSRYAGIGRAQELLNRGGREQTEENKMMSREAAEGSEYIKNRLAVTKEAETEFRLLFLIRRFQLLPWETLAVLLALSTQCDPKYSRIFGLLQGDPKCFWPTVGLLHELMAIYGENTDGQSPDFEKNGKEQASFPFTAMISETAALLFADSEKPEYGSVFSTPLLLREEILRFFREREMDFGPDNDVCSMVEKEPEPLFYEKELASLELLYQKEETKQKPIVYLEGPDPADILHVLSYLSAGHTMRVYCVDADAAAKAEESGISPTSGLRSLLIMQRLFPGVIAVKAGREISLGTAPLQRFLRLCRIISGAFPVFLYGQQKMPVFSEGEVPVPLTFPLPDVTRREQIWHYFLEEFEKENITVAPDISADDLADCYELTFGRIREACRRAGLLAKISENNEMDKNILRHSLTGIGGARFGELATRIESVYGWQDLQIADSQRSTLDIAIKRFRMRNRIAKAWELEKKNAYGNGVSVLLYGPPGTGKTMAAQVIAGEIGLPLFRVDISQLFSKYIGETSKNLAKVFTEASKTSCILFFDEADALFTKRTEVTDSKDRHANAETAYLLQRIEEYRGFSILATNHYNQFDQAFVRRIAYVVHLDSPTEEERLKLWKHTLPEQVPLENGIDFAFLAKNFELSGSNIKSILYSAAYLAGAEEKALGPRHIVTAMRCEFEKLGRLLNSTDLGNYAVYL